jgi:hypothetical protein
MINMIDDEKLKEYRNKVLERVNHTDILVSSIISSYYFKTGGVSLGFISTVLYQEPLSFKSRINILRNILKEMELKKEDGKDRIIKIRTQINKLDEMAKIRNIFAHCELKITIKGEEEHIFNPRDFHKSIDFEEEYQKLIKLDAEVNPILFCLYEELGGKYYKEEITM